MNAQNTLMLRLPGAFPIPPGFAGKEKIFSQTGL
jgi:hypothetical protein